MPPLLTGRIAVHSDAARGPGLEIYWRGQWCTVPWPKACYESELIKELTFLECFPILVAVIT